MQKERIITIVRIIIEMLINKQYDELVLNDSKKLLDSEDLSRAIQEYGGSVTAPPINEFQNIDIYIIKDNVEANVDFDIWIDNKRSDLTLTCNIVNDNDVYKYSIEGIHVL